MKTDTLKIKKKWFSIAEAARYLGVSKDTLRRWEKKGKLISRRTVGNHRRYGRKQLERILRQPIDQIIEQSSIKQDTKITKNIQSYTNQPSIPPTISPSVNIIKPKNSISPNFIKRLGKSNLIIVGITLLVVILLISSFLLLTQVKKTTQPPISPLPGTDFNQTMPR